MEDSTPAEGGRTEEPPIKKRRVRTGCLSCRQRKVKCDETRPVCENCSRLQLDCCWTSAAAEVAAPAPPVPIGISRRTKACDQCRAVKAGCSTDRPSCARCSSLGKQCTYQGRLESSTRGPGSTSTSSRAAMSRSGGPATQPSETLSTNGVAPNSSVSARANTAIQNSNCHQLHVSPSGTLPDLSSIFSQKPNDSGPSQGNVNSPNGEGSSMKVQAGGGSAGGPSAFSPLVNIPTASPAASLALSDLQATLGSKTDLNTLLDVYWNNFYHASFCSYVHRPSFTIAYEAGKIPMPLLQSVCAVACIYLTTDLQQPRLWMAEVEQHMSQGFREPSLDLLQASLHLVYFDMAEGNSTRSYMMVGHAARMSYALRLNEEVEVPGMTVAVRETRRRIMWALFAQDASISGGVRHIEVVPFESLHIRLPCNERNFSLSIPVKTRYLQLGDSPEEWASLPTEGLLSHIISLTAIRKEVFRYIVNLSSDPSLPWQPGSMFDRCRSHLLLWRQGLGPEMDFTPENIAARRLNKQLSQFFFVHMRFWGITYNLFRIAVHGFVEAAGPAVLLSAPHDWLRSVQFECYQAAAKVSDLCVTILENAPSFVGAESSLPVSLYESLRIQAWAMDNLIQLEDQEAHRSQASKRVNSTVEVIIRTTRRYNGGSKMYNALSKLVRRTQLRFIVDDSYHFAHSSTGTHSPVEGSNGLVSYGNISKTHYIYSIQRELAKLARRQAQNNNEAIVAPADLTTSAVQPPARPPQGSLPTIPPPLQEHTTFLPENGMSYNADDNNFNWLLDGTFTTFGTGDNFDIPVSTGIPPYDDISAMLNWQWPLDESATL